MLFEWKQGKKRAALGAAALMKFNREASNRVDRSHSNPDDWMNISKHP
jgi:hypothetical protein